MERFTDRFTYLSRLLDTVGDGSGTKNANVNGAVTPVLFKISPPTTGYIVVSRLLVEVRDTGVFSAEKYGVLATLANGLQVGLFDDDDGSLIQSFTSLPITSNAGWGRLCYDADRRAWGVGDEFLSVRWTFTASGTSVILRPGDPAFGVKVQDDLTGLVEHYFQVQGYQQ